jgi:hypothetical protein
VQTVYVETSIVSFLRENAVALPDSVEREQSFPIICTPKDMLDDYDEARA